MIKRKTSQSQQAFTLIELLIAVVIVGILTAIAVPSYQNYVVKGNRAAAQAFMMDVASREKQYMLDARQYTSSLCTLYNVSGVSDAVPSEVYKHYAPTSCTSALAVSSTPPTFTITLTPTTTGSQSNDGWLSLTSDGTKGSQYSGKW